MGGPEKIPQIVKDLNGIIFKDPTTGPFDLETGGTDWARGWQTADEYLSGDVRRKLYWARHAAEKHPEYAVNVEMLEKVQPVDLKPSEISVRVGASWIDPKYYQQFMFELFQTPWRLQGNKIKLMYSHSSGEWRIQNKGADSIDNVSVYTTYGTKRINAYEIFEAALNQRDVRIFDLIRDGRMARKFVSSMRSRQLLPSKSRKLSVKRSRTGFSGTRNAGKSSAKSTMRCSTTSGPASTTVLTSILWA